MDEATFFRYVALSLGSLQWLRSAQGS